MIRRLRLKAWRAFAALDLTFEDGVTFVVAENGVGKTSLVEAAAWGIYGSQSGIDGKAARRKDGDIPATVTVDLELPNGRELSITRTTADPAAVVATLDGTQLADTSLESLLTDAFGANIDYLSRVTVLPTDVLRGYADESFQLRQHLCRVYGIDTLEAAANKIARYLSNVAKETKTLRSDVQARVADETALSIELEDLRGEIARIEQDRNDLQDQIRDGERRAALALVALEAEAVNRERLAVLAELTTEATQQLELRADVDTLVSLVAGEDERLAAEIDTARREQSAAQGRLDSVTEALNALRSADAECPVCRRPLNEGDAAHAETAHAEEAATLAAQVAFYSEELAILSSRLRTTRDISRRLHAVPPARDIPLEDPQNDPSDDLEGFRLALGDLSETVGALKSQSLKVEHALGDSIAARNEQARAVELYRREAIAGATRNTLEGTVRSLLAVNVEPVAREVTSRWKRVFGERGSLELSPDGELSLTRGGFVVPFEDFSAGEKVIALLTARLLITAASTRASFMWLDEPLEHLDPSNRRIVASLLATATAPLRQVVVTTYEEPLARRLAEQVPTVHLTYVRASGD